MASAGSGLVWRWDGALRGLLYALPAAAVAPHDPSQSMSLAVGLLPAVAIGLPPTRRGRFAVLVVGVCAALSILAGSLLVQLPWLAVAGLFVLAVAAALLAARRRVGVLAMSLCLPLVGAGLSYDDVSSALGVTALIACGSLYAYLLSLPWPLPTQPPATAPTATAPRPPLDRDHALDYGLRLGAAGAAAAACGLALAPTHPGWPVVAALMVMRPVADMQRLRSVGRVLSVLVGGVAALLLLRADPPNPVYGLAVLLAIVAATATQASRWYVLPAVPTFLVLLLLLHTDPAQAHGRFNERVGATVVGVALAYLFGLLLPRWTRRRRVSPPRA
ncbi:FUSC family protein [Streptacidiphilus cavernicola]|uniref:FUSC family protein n=1 Tax=Streptacidiphilus cavernicola TaxID=3342716 RepID=A0ABV6VW07_9ACTN